MNGGARNGRRVTEYESYVRDLNRAIETLLDVTAKKPAHRWEQEALLQCGRVHTGLSETLVHDALLELVLDRTLVEDGDGLLERVG